MPPSDNKSDITSWQAAEIRAGHPRHRHPQEQQPPSGAYDSRAETASSDSAAQDNQTVAFSDVPPPRQRGDSPDSWTAGTVMEEQADADVNIPRTGFSIPAPSEHDSLSLSNVRQQRRALLATVGLLDRAMTTPPASSPRAAFAPDLAQKGSPTRNFGVIHRAIDLQGYPDFPSQSRDHILAAIPRARRRREVDRRHRRKQLLDVLQSALDLTSDDHDLEEDDFGSLRASS